MGDIKPRLIRAECEPGHSRQARLPAFLQICDSWHLSRVTDQWPGLLLALMGNMSSREFVDSRGVSWRVWSTVPAGGAVRATKFIDGWLTFESSDSLRRLAPLPPNWVDAQVDRLELMCRAAQEVPRHTGPFPRVKLDEGRSSNDDASAGR